MARLRQHVLGPDDSRAPRRTGSHGLTANEIDLMKANGCQTCGRRDRPLQIDHDHRHCASKTGCRFCVRGAVCGPCNMVLHLIADNAQTAENMARYLRRFGS